MKHQYYPPTYREEQFHCIYCNVFARQSWFNLYTHMNQSAKGTDFEASVCVHCHKHTYWYQKRMIVPSDSPVAPAHPDLPESCETEYEEARSVFGRSPRAAAALLRLAVQKLMAELGEGGGNINNDIKSLVAKGLPVQVQKALDYCRVVGNNAVHPGEIDLNDTPEIAQNIFSMINFIVEDRITRPKEIDTLYSQLPEGAKEAVKKRDGEKDKPGSP
jgi:hypothetical protein